MGKSIEINLILGNYKFLKWTKYFVNRKKILDNLFVMVLIHFWMINKNVSNSVFTDIFERSALRISPQLDVANCIYCDTKKWGYLSLYAFYITQQRLQSMYRSQQNSNFLYNFIFISGIFRVISILETEP